MVSSRVLAFLALELSTDVALAEVKWYRDNSKCSSPNGDGGYDCYTCPGEPMTCHSGCKAVYERRVSSYKSGARIKCPGSQLARSRIKYNCECPGSSASKTALMILSIVVILLIVLCLIPLHPERAVAVSTRAVAAVQPHRVQPAAAITVTVQPQRTISVQVPDGGTVGQQLQVQEPNDVFTVIIPDADVNTASVPDAEVRVHIAVLVTIGIFFWIGLLVSVF